MWASTECCDTNRFDVGSARRQMLVVDHLLISGDDENLNLPVLGDDGV